MAADTGRLVRDLLPTEIKAAGREPRIRVADDAEYRAKLRATLAAAARDAAVAGSLGDLVEGLTDVLELVYAIGDTIGYSPEMLEALRRAKHDKRGGFSARLVWLGNKPRQSDDEPAWDVSSSGRDYGLCQNCLKNRATVLREDTPYCRTCLDRYDTSPTGGRPE